MNGRSFNQQWTRQLLDRSLQRHTGVSILSETVSKSTEAVIGAGCVLTGVLTASIIRQTLIYIITSTAI